MPVPSAQAASLQTLPLPEWHAPAEGTFTAFCHLQAVSSLWQQFSGLLWGLSSSVHPHPSARCWFCSRPRAGPDWPSHQPKRSQGHST